MMKSTSKTSVTFLESKGYEVIGLTNGRDAIDYLETNKAIDIVLLDESMAGLSGLETLDIQNKTASTPHGHGHKK